MQDESSQAEEYRQAQARRLLACYEKATGRPAPSVEALMTWVTANPDQIPRNEHGQALPLYEGEPAEFEQFKTLWRRPDDES